MFRALWLLTELEGKRYRERNVTEQTKGALKTLQEMQLPGRNISRLLLACKLPLLRSVPQDGALQTDHGKQEARSQIISKGGEEIKALAAPTQSGDLAGYWTR